MNFHQPLFGAAVVALSALSFAQNTPPAPTPTPARDTTPIFLLAPSGKVLGLKVHNDSEKSCGEIGDLLIDPRSGEIRYGVLEVGGVLGMGEERRVVPWIYIQILADEKNPDKFHARTTLTEAQVKAAPSAKNDQVLNEELDRRIEAAFGKDDAWTFHGDGKPQFAWLSKMDGVEIKDPAGKEIGKVEDLILAPQNGCVAYADVDLKKDAGGKHIALPFARLQYAFDADKKLTATTPVEITKFQSAPEYDSKDWKRVSAMPYVSEISTYYSCDPYWKTSRFASAHKPPTSRP